MTHSLVTLAPSLRRRWARRAVATTAEAAHSVVFVGHLSMLVIAGLVGETIEALIRAGGRVRAHRPGTAMNDQTWQKYGRRHGEGRS
jgi:hypothetical protein